MFKKYQGLLTLLVSAGVFLSFQNCSPVKFESANKGLAEKTQDSENLNPDGDSTDSEIPLISDSDTDQDHDSDLPQGPGVPLPPDPSNDPGPGNSDVDDLYDLTDEHLNNPDILAARCGILRGLSLILPKVPNGAVVNNFRGLRIASVDNVVSISNSRFGLILIARKAGASIGSINNSSGSILSCGVSIGSLNNYSGNILMVGGDVGEINGYGRGWLMILRGQVIGDVNNFNGRALIERP